MMKPVLIIAISFGALCNVCSINLGQGNTNITLPGAIATDRKESTLVNTFSRKAMAYRYWHWLMISQDNNDC